MFEWNNYRVYFAGDTGYSDVFKDIKKQLGEMDICLMPTTAWFQRHWHFAPEDAVQAAEDLGVQDFNFYSKTDRSNIFYSIWL